MKIFSNRGLSTVIAGSALIGSLALAGTAFAAGPGPGGFGHGMRPAIVGTVASNSGGVLTITAKSWPHVDSVPANTTAAVTTYTVNTTSATTVTKSGTASTVSAIAVGDVVMVQGTVSGTAVAATAIRDGVMGRWGKGQPDQRPGTIPSMPAITGNGEPVIGGNVTAISGNTAAVTNASNITYTVDVTNAKITKRGVTTATVANIVIGDSVVVQGTVNGTSVTAASVIDQGAVPSTSVTAPGNSESAPAHRGFLGAIGGFFAHLFGF